MSDPLEDELSALRPQPVSADLRRRVGERLSAPPSSRRWLWGIAIAGVLVAGGLIAFVRPNRPEPAPPVPPAVVVPQPAPPESESPAPSVLAYRQALARSPEALDALLDQQAAGPSAAGPVQVGMLTRSPGTINGFIGDD